MAQVWCHWQIYQDGMPYTGDDDHEEAHQQQIGCENDRRYSVAWEELRAISERQEQWWLHNRIVNHS